MSMSQHVHDLDGAFDFSAFQMPTLTRLPVASSRVPNADPALTGAAKARIERLVEERDVTATVSDGPTMEAPVTLLHAGEDSTYYAGAAPGTTDEALAAVARRANVDDAEATRFLVTVFGADEASGLIELVAERKL